MVDSVEPLGLATQRSIETIGDFRYFLQRRFVKLCPHHCATGIAQDVHLTIWQAQGNRLPLRAPHTDGVDHHALFCSGPGGLQRIALEVFAISDEHEDPVVALLLIEEAGGLADGAGHIRALTGNEVGIERLE